MDSSYTTKAQLRSSLQRVADKIESAEDKIDVLSGVANDITARIEGTEDDILSLQTQVDGISVPTKTSDLINDSGYIKSVNGKSANVAGAVSLVPLDIGAASNKNLLDNWYFADPINQRGQTVYTGGAYSIDRWKIWSAGTTLQITDDGILLTNTNPNDDWIIQPIEIGSLKPGIYTLSCFSENGVRLIQFNAANGGNILYHDSTSDGMLSYGTFSVSSSNLANNHRVGILTKEGSALIAAKLELGPIQTLAHQDASGNWVLNDPPPNKASELAKCQRYQPFVGYPSNQYSPCGFAVVMSVRQCIGVISLPVSIEKRPASPVNFSGDIIFRVGNPSTFRRFKSAEIEMCSQNVISIRCDLKDNEENMVIGSCGDLYMNYGMLMFDCNL